MACWFHIQFAAIFAQRVMFLASFKNIRNTTFSILPSVESVLRYLRWSCLLMGKSMSGWCYCSRLSLSFVNATSLERACTSQTMIPNLLYQHRQCNTPGKYFRQVLILVDRPLKIAWTWKFRWSINITLCFAVKVFCSFVLFFCRLHVLQMTIVVTGSYRAKIYLGAKIFEYWRKYFYPLPQTDGLSKVRDCQSGNFFLNQPLGHWATL